MIAVVIITAVAIPTTATTTTASNLAFAARAFRLARGLNM